MSDSVLSESAQLRSALQAKTYLQALSPDERRRLLKGAKVPGHRRKHHTSAVAAATARRDELQQLLDQEKHRFIDNQTVLAQQPDISYSSKPAAHETAAWETARLRVRATSMAAENDALKNHVAQLMHQISNMDRSVQVVSNEARARSQRMTEAAAARIAELEDQVERQQRALSEMSVASEELARDNCAVSDEVVQLREDKASQSQNMEALQDRVAKLQELCMRDLDQSRAITVHDSMQQSNLLQLATPEMLAVSQPPPSFPLAQTAKTSAIVPALHEIETLRRERRSLKEQVKSKSDKLARTEEANAELSTLLAAERKAAKLAGAAAQKQLLGSMRRIQYVVSKAKESEASQQQKDAYVRKLEARLLNQHKAPSRRLKPEDENSKAATGSIRQRSKGTVAAASKQATQAAVPPEGSSSSHSAPATPMFTYHTLSHPLQDASNLPSGHVVTGPFAPQQAPIEVAPDQGQRQQGQPSPSCPGQGHWQQGQPFTSYPGQGQGHWQHGQPSRSSSDCFSMDPAQLEADIAALTSAIAQDAADLDGASEGVPSYHGYPAARDSVHAASTRPPINECDSRSEGARSGLSGCGLAFKGSEAQQFSHHPPQSFPQSPMQTHQQAYRHTQQGVEVPVAASDRGLLSRADRHELHQQDEQQEPSGAGHRRQDEDEGAADIERPWWHRRQSKEERLADAAEARLLSLAGRPGSGSEHEPPDWHLKRHQPISYNRKGMQVDNNSSSCMPNPPLPQFTSQEAAAGSAHLDELSTRGPAGPQTSGGSNVRGREMLRAALHNLATHDSSPPSSTSCHSAASSHHDAPTLSAPVTSITANECLDGSALFDSAASPSCSAPAEGFLHTTKGGHQAPHSTEADVRHHKRPNAATGVKGGDHIDQPAAHQLHDSGPSLQHVSRDQQQQHRPGSRPPLQIPGQTTTQMSLQHLSSPPNQMPTQLGCHMDQRQKAVGLPGQLPRQSLGRSAADNFSSASQAKPGPLPQAANNLLLRSDSSEELMSLEELEHRIASLNTTLLRAPSELQAASVSSDQAGAKTKQSPLYANDGPAVYRQQRQRQAGVHSGRGDRPHKLGREADQSSDSTDGLAEEQPGMTAWQKLTAMHQAPGASSNRVDATNGEGDSYSSASSPPESTGRLMQAAPLQSPPSTGLRHYSAASKHVSDDWDGDSDTRVLEWAETCSQGASQHPHAQQTGTSKGSGRSSTAPQASSSRPFTMLHSRAAVLSSRHLSHGSATTSKQALQAKLSPVAASWRQYDRSSTTTCSKVPAQASNLSSQL